jgi:hypothetical protein
MPTVYHDVNFGRIFWAIIMRICVLLSVVAKGALLCHYRCMKSYLFTPVFILSVIATTAAATATATATATAAAQTQTAVPAAAAPDDPIASAASGLIAQIEDDVNPGGDLQLVSMKSDGCKTVITGALATPSSDPASSDPASGPATGIPAATRTWTIDWAVPGSVAPGDTFVFIDVAPVKIAIVGDASKPDQAAKLSALFGAMFETQLDCTTQF